MNGLRRKFLAAIRGLFAGNRVNQYLAVLPVIRQQLHETNRQVEEAVVNVCSNFTGIAARAREAVTESSSLLESDSSQQGATVESAIEASRQTIASLLDRLEQATKLSALAVAGMDEVSRTVTGIEDLLGQIQRIAFTNKLVALNAKIEAVHVGDLGSGFEVVADEISRQAERSTELAGGITDHIQTMRDRVDTAAGDLREFLAESRQKLDQSRGESEGALNALLSLHQRTAESLQRKTEENARLTNDIAAAVVGLQFQDRVKQRVEHVIEGLEKLEKAMGGQDSNVLADVHASYTMESERQAHRAAISQPESPATEPMDMEVELF
jgi:methyl-accepting chemotaxis protein